LPVGRVEDRQQREDRRHDPADHGSAGGAERHQNRKRRFRPVRGRRESVEAHCGHTLELADLALGEFPVSQSAAKDQLSKEHLDFL
jgi:hypothetical protein